MLTKRKRRFLFWVTITSFFILSIGVVFYSLGYRFGPKWQIQKTGGIFVQANQSGAAVFVDGKLQKNTSLFSENALVKNLKSGKHEVKVSRDTFHDWYKTLEVVPEMVVARDVLLIPTEIVPRPVATSTPELYPTYYLSKHTIYRRESPKPKSVFVGVDKFWQLPASGELLILGEDKNFYINNRRITVGTSTTENFLDMEAPEIKTLISLLLTKNNLIFDDGQNRVIYWDAHTIGSYWTGKLDKLPQWQATRSILILTLPAEIHNVMIYPEHGDYLLMEMGNGIWALEMDASGGQNLIPLYSGINPKLLGKNANTVFVSDADQYFAIDLP